MVLPREENELEDKAVAWSRGGLFGDEFRGGGTMERGREGTVNGAAAAARFRESLLVSHVSRGRPETTQPPKINETFCIVTVLVMS